MISLSQVNIDETDTNSTQNIILLSCGTNPTPSNFNLWDEILLLVLCRPLFHTSMFLNVIAVTYLENNRAGITILGFTVDRAWLHTIFIYAGNYFVPVAFGLDNWDLLKPPVSMIQIILLYLRIDSWLHSSNGVKHILGFQVELLSLVAAQFLSSKLSSECATRGSKSIVNWRFIHVNVYQFTTICIVRRQSQKFMLLLSCRCLNWCVRWIHRFGLLLWDARHGFVEMLLYFQHQQHLIVLFSLFSSARTNNANADCTKFMLLLS